MRVYHELCPSPASRSLPLAFLSGSSHNQEENGNPKPDASSVLLTDCPTLHSLSLFDDKLHRQAGESWHMLELLWVLSADPSVSYQRQYS